MDNRELFIAPACNVPHSRVEQTLPFRRAMDDCNQQLELPFTHRTALPAFLAEVRARLRTPIPEDLDPIAIILSRVSFNPHTVESRSLRKATLAVIATEGHLAESDIWALGKDALGLLDAFAARRFTGRYSAAELRVFVERLHGTP